MADSAEAVAQIWATVYGDYRNPSDLGSGGAGHPGQSPGSSGGGLVRITAGSAQIDGMFWPTVVRHRMAGAAGVESY